MAVIDLDPAAIQELREHRRSYLSFERMVLFAAMHVALVLSCLALAFVGHIPWIAFLLGIGGTLALIVGFSVTASNTRT